MFNNLQSAFIKYFKIKSNVLLARACFNMVSVDCLYMHSCSSFLPAEGSLISNLQRQIKPSFPHKINHFFGHKHCSQYKILAQLVTAFHISETEQNATQENMYFKTSSLASVSKQQHQIPQHQFVSTVWPTIIICQFRNKDLFESCLEEDTTVL